MDTAHKERDDEMDHFIIETKGLTKYYGDTARDPVVWKERREIYMGKYPVHAQWCMRSVCRKWKGNELVSGYTMFLISIGRLWRKICNGIHEVGCGNFPVWIAVCTGIPNQVLQRKQSLVLYI